MQPLTYGVLIYIFDIFDIRHPTSEIRNLISGTQHPISNIQLLTSDF